MSDSSNLIEEWRETSFLPEVRAEGAGLCYQGFLYYLGGKSGSGIKDTVYFSAIKADGSLEPWKTTSPLKYARTDGKVAVHNNFIYWTGGWNGIIKTNILVGNIGSNGEISAWRATHNMPARLHDHEAIVTGGYMYIIGGWDETFVKHSNKVFYARILSDGSIEPFYRASDLLVARQHHASVFYNGYIYTLGGRDKNNNYLSSVEYAKVNSDGSLSDWKQTSPLPIGRIHFPAVAAGKRIFSIGGRSAQENDKRCYQTLIKDDGSLEAWVEDGNINQAKNDFIAGFFKGYIYEAGGDPYTRAVHYSLLLDINEEEAEKEEKETQGEGTSGGGSSGSFYNKEEEGEDADKEEKEAKMPKGKIKKINLFRRSFKFLA